MDTIPFHFMMAALDIVLLGGFFFFLSWRSTPRKTWSPSVYDGLLTCSPPKESLPHLSIFMDIFSVAFFGGLGLVGIRCFAKIFQTNTGQCIAEGLTYHGTVFLLTAAWLLLRKHRFFASMFFGFIGLFIFGLGFDMLVWEPYRLTVEKYVIETPKLKKPLRIVFVADIQTNRIGKHERRTLEIIKKQQADLIILGGDYLQYYEGERDVADLPERFNKLFREIPLTAPLGVYAVKGNIDSSESSDYNALFQGTSVEPVFDSTVIENLGIDQGLGPIDIVLLSLDDSAGDVGDRGKTETGNFIVMAGHRPNFAVDGYRSDHYQCDYKGYRDAPWAPDLMLAGHTHGSQAALPFYGPLGIGGDSFVKQIPREMLSGMFTYKNGGHLLVSRGSGMERGWAPRIRLFCKPEISVIDLVPVGTAHEVSREK